MKKSKKELKDLGGGSGLGGERENECGFYLYSFTYQKKNEHG